MENRRVNVCSCEALISYLTVLIFSSIETFNFVQVAFHALLQRVLGGAASTKVRKKARKSGQRYYRYSTHETQRNAKGSGFGIFEFASPAMLQTRHLVTTGGPPKRPPKQNGRQELFGAYDKRLPVQVVVVLIFFGPVPSTSFFPARTAP